jgi:hypothetical protein
LIFDATLATRVTARTAISKKRVHHVVRRDERGLMTGLLQPRRGGVSQGRRLAVPSGARTQHQRPHDPAFFNCTLEFCIILIVQSMK